MVKPNDLKSKIAQEIFFLVLLILATFAIIIRGDSSFLTGISFMIFGILNACLITMLWHDLHKYNLQEYKKLIENDN